MFQRLFYILVLLLLLVTIPLRAQYYGSTPEGGSWTNSEYNTTEGTDFWVTYMFNYGNLQQDVNLKLYLYAVAREQTTFRVQYADGTLSEEINVPAGGRSNIYTVDQTKTYITDPDLKMYKGLHVTSGKPISLYALNQNAEAGSYDATNILPTKTLGREYVIQTYATDGVATEFALLGTKNNTRVEIDYYEKNVETEVVTRNNISIILNQGETYLHRSSGIEYSLTGTTVCTSHAIAIFCGGQHADIPRGSSNKNHIYSQLYPASMWGKHFVVQNVYKHKKDFYRVTAAQNGTTVKINGTQVATLNSNETYDGIVSSPNHASKADYIETNKNALICFYATDGVLSNDTIPDPDNPDNPFTRNYEGAPAMAPVVPLELGCKDLIFATLNSPGITKHYANIVTYKAYKSGMQLDGANISSQFADLGSTPYSYAQIQLTDGTHVLRNTLGQSRKEAVFTTIVYGLGMNNMGRQESYAYSPGSRILRDIDMLINNQYIKEKTICITQPLTFTALIGGDYSTVDWNFQDYGGTTTGNTSLEKTHTFSSAGDYDVTLTVGRQYPINCTFTTGSIVYDTVHATIHVKEIYNASFHQKICEGESVILRGRDENGVIQEYTYNTNTSESRHFYTIDGCDSIVDVKIEVGHPETKEYSQTACIHYTWHGTTYNSSGRYEWTTTNEYGCTVTEYLNLTILQPVVGPTTEITICSNSAYDWNGQHITKAGEFTATLTAVNGCDSIANLRVKIENEYKDEKSLKLCYGQTYYWRGRTLTTADTYTDHSPSQNGCDSTFILHFSFYPDYMHIQKSAETCADQPYRFGNENLTESGTYTKTFASKEGCDSTVTLTLTVWPLEYDTIHASICQGEKYSFGGKQLTSSGEYKRTETNNHGCTKTTVLYLTVNPHTHKYDTVRICEKDLPYTYAGKYTANKAGDYQQTLSVKNTYGCDSIFHLHLIVDKAIITPLNVHWCANDGPYNHPNPSATNLQNLTQTGVYTHTFVAANGCDSIIELHLTVGTRTYSNMRVTLCDEELPWRDPNNSSLRLYRDTTYNDTILNKSGCDSVITVAFKVNKTYNITVDTTICESEAPYNHPNKRFFLFQNLTQTKTITQTISSVNDCDSTVTLRLTVNPTTYYHQYVSVCEEALPYSYGDHGQKASTGGEYRDILNTKNQYGCDSVLILHLEVLETIVDAEYDTICDNETYSHPDSRTAKLQNLSIEGIYRDTLKSVTGCDSVIELHLKVWNTYEHNQYDTICDNESFDFHGHIFEHLSAKDTPYTFDSTLTSIHGCDSMIHCYLTVCPTYFGSDTVYISDKQSVTWIKNGKDTTVYGESCPDKPVGMEGLEARKDLYLFPDSLLSMYGCDSVYYKYIFVRPTFSVWDSAYVCQDRSDNYLWEEHQNSSRLFNESGENVTTLPLDQVGKYIYYDSLKTISGDDSIFGLHLMIYPTYYLPVQRTDTHICDNQRYYFHTAYFDTVYNTDGGDEISYYFDIGKTDATIHGCDSAVWHRVFVHPTYYREEEDSVCQTTPYIWGGHDSSAGHGTVWVWDEQQQKRIGRDAIPTNVPAGVYIYVDSLQTTTCPDCPGHGCDSVWVLKLRVDSIYAHFDTITMSDEEARKWQHTIYIGSKVHTDTLSSSWFVGETQQQIVRIPSGSIINDFDTIYPTIHKCDSMFYLHLLVGPTYRDTIEGWTCDNEPYHWYHAGDSVHEARPDITILTPGWYYDSLRTKQFGFDSIYVLNLYNYRTYHYSEEDTICQYAPYHWSGHEESEYFYLMEHSQWVHRDNISTDMWGHYTYIDSLKTHEPELHPNQNRHSGCDSIWTLHLFIPQTYHFYDTIPLCENDSAHWQGMLFTGSQYTAYGKTFNPAPFDSIRTDLKHGLYHVDIRRPTIYACDSIYHLTLNVHEVAHTDSLDSVCQGHPFYNPNWNWGQGMYMNTERVGTYVSVDTIHSKVTGCDSIVTLTLRVDSVYNYHPYFEFCQDTIHTDTIVEWMDEAGKPHTFKLDISQANTFSYIDSLTSIHGCDSTFGVKWVVHPIYRFDTIIHMCENTRIRWQDTLYTGDSVRNITLEDSVILKPGVYERFRHHETVMGCDSDYYATIYVHAIYDTLTQITICENDGFVWYQEEHPWGVYNSYADTLCKVSYCDTIRLLPYEALLPQAKRDTTMRYAERMLSTIYGCDSLSRIWVTVKPSYCILTDTTICSNERVKYRNKFFSSKDTIYTEHLYTSDGCDSVYLLRLHVRPIFMNVRRDTLCDNETLYHASLNHNDPIWNPGDEIRDPEWEYYDMIYTDENGCDSIYRYYLTIYPTFRFSDTISMCSNDSVDFHGARFVGEHIEYPTEAYIQPYEVIYIDSLQTVQGCDSVYKLTAIINPAYRHRDTLTICDSDTVIWRDSVYTGTQFGHKPGDGVPAKEHVIYHSFKTKEHNCDSIYELHLFILPTYYISEPITICDNDSLYWQGMLFTGSRYTAFEKTYDLTQFDSVRLNLESGIYTADIWRPTIHGCDSVHHLELTVNPVTDTLVIDTICFGESYSYGTKIAYEDGIYRDTVTSVRYGCDSIITLHLEVIEPTVPTAWADSICADDNAYELYWSYMGEYPPVRFILKYDSLGHKMNFEDMEWDIDMQGRRDTMFVIPMPDNDGDRRNYPRPDNYNITVILDNGKCKEPEKWCATDTTIVLSYPSWITQQRFGDVIAIYNDKYNGDYKWQHYQWYHGDSLLEGETHEYLYVPTGLVVGDQYHVRLTREGESQDFQTCPITIVADPIVNDYAPNMGYLSVTPSCVCPCSPYINILSRKDGYYRISACSGIFMKQDIFRAGETRVDFPSTEGLYIVQLWSPDTPEEPYRSIKVVVSPICAEMLYENISF